MSDMLHITDYTLPPAGREAAGTKWNFHRYSPGLVGGHCIPVDPYYLVHRAEELGYHPQVIPDFFTKNRVKTALRVGSFA